MAKKRTSSKDDATTLAIIRNAALKIHESISKRKAPDMKLPIRSLANVNYDTKKGFFEIGKAIKKRTLSVNTVKTFAQTLKMMCLSKQLVEADDFATAAAIALRYYDKTYQHCLDENTSPEIRQFDFETGDAAEIAQRLRQMLDQHTAPITSTIL